MEILCVKKIQDGKRKEGTKKEQKQTGLLDKKIKPDIHQNSQAYGSEFCTPADIGLL